MAGRYVDYQTTAPSAGHDGALRSIIVKARCVHHLEFAMILAFGFGTQHASVKISSSVEINKFANHHVS